MMLKWKDGYSCHNQGIDDQHKKLIQMLNQMQEIIDLKDDTDHYDEIVEIFHALKEYTVEHFNYEEGLFEKNNYDPVSTKLHKLEHKSFINKVSEIDFDEIDRDQIESVRSVLDFVSKWIDQHILDTDIKFGMFLKSKA